MNDDNKEDINKSEDNKVETDNQSEVDQNDTTKDINPVSYTHLTLPTSSRV